MSTQNWNRVRDLFLEVCDLPPAERAAYLEQACNGDQQVRREVEELLDSTDDASDFLESPPAGVGERESRPEVSDRWIDRRIGPYRLVRLLATGGMGTVYLAERADEQFHQTVAIKLVRPGMMDREGLRRFRAERQLLAMLEHPNIARLLDGGVTDDATPYLVMEYIEGASMVEYCDQRKLPTSGRLRLFRQICDAVEYAHRKLIVHRDLKPSNILVTEDGTPKLLDFGIAKLLRSVEGVGREETLPAQRPLTPEYASPEQIRGEPVTTVSDVYSLGVILYRLLTGHRPYKMTSRHVRELERTVLEAEPVVPSSVIWRVEETGEHGGELPTVTPQSVSAVRDGTPNRLSRRLRGDLDNVILKALRKEPERRYASARALADDIDNYLANRPVTARRDTIAYRTTKFVRRHVAGVSAAVVVFLALLCAAGGIVWQAEVARSQRDAAVEAEAEAEAVVNFLEDMLISVRPTNEGADARVRDVLNRAATRVADWDEVNPRVIARIRGTIGRAYEAIGLSDRAEPHLRAALAIWTDTLGPAHTASIRAASDLGNLLAGVGRLDEAEPVLRNALAGSQSGSEPESSLTEEIKLNLAELLTERGALDDAEQLLRDVYERQRARLHPDNFALAQTAKRLAAVKFRQGDYREAEALLREAMRIHELAGPAGVPVLLENLVDLAEALEAQGRNDEARQHFARAEAPCRRALAMHRKMMGDDHLMTITQMSDLGHLLAGLDKLDEAEQWLRMALAGTEKLAESDKRDSARARNNLGLARHSLAVVLARRGKLEQADAMLRAALDIRRNAVGSRRLELAETLAALADVVEQLGKVDEAAGLRLEALAIRRALLPDGHPDVQQLERRFEDASVH